MAALRVVSTLGAFFVKLESGVNAACEVSLN